MLNSDCLSGIPYLSTQVPSDMSSVPDYPNDDALLSFDDNFESSNLMMAFHHDEDVGGKREGKALYNHHYLLTVRLDYNTRSYGQWFYFKVMRKETPFSFSRNGGNLFKFSIINMTKNSSLFGKGLKISVCRNGVWQK